MTRSRRGTRRSRTVRDRDEVVSVAPAADHCLVTGKVRYETEDAAFEAAYEFQQNHNFTVGSDDVYRCPFCTDFHITGRSKRAKLREGGS